MAKFRIVRKMSLDFLGDDWKDCYLELTPITTAEFQNKELAELADLDRTDNEQVLEGLEKSVDILEEHLVGGKGIGEDGEEVDIEKGDIVELPAEVLVKALDFLSQGSAVDRKQPSAK